MKTDDFDINEIIDKGLIVTRFQPIYCVKRQTTLAVEALSRGYLPDTGVIIPPDRLFHAATRSGRLLDLDRLCRRKSVEAYKNLYLQNKDLLLFINIDTAVIDENVVGSNMLLNLVKEFDIDPCRVLIEIIESDVKDASYLQKFVDNYRSNNFLIGIDDIGAGYSNLDRVSLVKPDIIKIDRQIISGIDGEFHKQEVMKALVSLAKNIGALVVAEGVETEDEAITSLELGADLFQGFLFAKPMIPYDLLPYTDGNNMMQRVAMRFKTYILGKISEKRIKYEHYECMAKQFIDNFVDIPQSHFNELLFELIENYNDIEYAYVINNDGIQITNTVGHISNSNTPRCMIFYPDRKGADQSLKDYYIFIQAGLEKYVTEPYISSASGRKSLTISTLFENTCENDRFILCLDIFIE